MRRSGAGLLSSQSSALLVTKGSSEWGGGASRRRLHHTRSPTLQPTDPPPGGPSTSLLSAPPGPSVRASPLEPRHPAFLGGLRLVSIDFTVLQARSCLWHFGVSRAFPRSGSPLSAAATSHRLDFSKFLALCQLRQNSYSFVCLV